MTKHKIVVVGLGPAGPELVTAQVASLMQSGIRVALRTSRHPSAVVAPPAATSFDSVYERQPNFESVYSAIVDELAELSSHEPVLYAVPGSPLVAERTVELLLQRHDLEVEVLPALSFVDLAWVRLGVDPLTGGARILDAHRAADDLREWGSPCLIAQCHDRNALSEVKLAVEGESAVILHHLGLADEQIVPVEWSELDRTLEPDHLTSVWVPSGVKSTATAFVDLERLTKKLRNECPWDREQTHESLTKYAVEEVYELVDAIDSGDSDDMAEELGDVLFQVMIHSALAEEQNEFSVADVAVGVHDKLVARHPHVFGDEIAPSAAAVRSMWEQRKLAEKGRASLLDGVPKSMPALAQAEALQKRAATVGFDWPSAEGPLDKVREELQELLDADEGHRSEELGDLLFAVVNLARHLGVDPDTAMRAANRKFTARFNAVESLAAAQQIDLLSLDLAALDELWNQAKAAERSTD